MTDPLDSIPDQAGFGGRLHNLRFRMWLGLILVIVPFAFMVTWLGSLAVRFPAASLPAFLGAMIGYYRAHRQGIQLLVMSPVTDDFRVQTYTIRWGIIVGALGYAAFATIGVGIPAPEPPLGWRLFGGLVFGAAAGAGAGAFLPLLALPVEWIRERRRRKRAA